MSESVGIVDVLVPGGNLIQPLADEPVQLVRDVARVSRVGDAADDIRAEAELLIEFPHEQQAGVCRERAACEIKDEFRLESEAKLAITLCSLRTSCVGNLRGLRQPRKYHDFFEGDGVFTYSLRELSGLESQELACRDYAKRQNLTVSKVFIEEGESAKFADRTQLLELLTYCKGKSRKIEVLLVWKIDRFARNVEDHYTIKAALKKLGVQIASVTEPIQADANGKLLETILAGFAQFDNDIRALRSIQGMRQRLREGIWPWKPRSSGSFARHLVTMRSSAGGASG